MSIRFGHPEAQTVALRTHDVFEIDSNNPDSFGALICAMPRGIIIFELAQ